MPASKTGGQKYQLEQYGHVSDGKPLPLEYQVRVTSFRNAATVIAPMQEDLMMSVDSQWVPLVPLSLLSNANIAIQAFSGGKKSFATKAATRRIWTGSSPMQLSVRMRFEAISDAFQEVQEPCRLLMAMAMPSLKARNGERADSEEEKWHDFLPFVSPPGPTPFAFEGLLNLRRSGAVGRLVENLDDGKGGDFIMIEFGKYITFENVIIKNVSCITPIKFTAGGYPISATMNIVFETYEMMTVEGLQQAFDNGKLPLSENEVQSASGQWDRNI